MSEHEPMLEVLVRRHYREHDLHDLRSWSRAGRDLRRRRLHARRAARPGWSRRSARSTSWPTPTARSPPRSPTRWPPGTPGDEAVVDLYLHWPGAPDDPDEASEELADWSAPCRSPPTYAGSWSRSCPGEGRPVDYFTYRPDAGRRGRRGRPGSWRAPDGRPAAQPLAAAQLRRHPDRRARGRAALRVRGQGEPRRPPAGRAGPGPPARRRTRRRGQRHRACRTPSGRWRTASRRSGEPRTARGAAGTKLDMNHVWVQVWPVVEADLEQLTALQGKITPLTDGAGIAEVLAQGRVARPGRQRRRRVAIRFHARPGAGVTASIEAPPTEPLKPLDEYTCKVRPGPPPWAGLPLRARRRARRSRRQPGRARPRRHRATWCRSTGRAGSTRPGILVAVVTTPTTLHPEGVTRVVLCGDPTKALGAVSEPECSRIIAAIDLAERMQVPVEWFALSAGARISMDSGTENMDWVAAALQADRRVHPGRRRDQRRGRRHQRRGAAVLERRGDDADAHQGHPGDDAGQRDGAHRQAVARLLRRGVGRGQLRHRRLRPGDGPQRPGAVLGARPRRRLRAS